MEPLLTQIKTAPYNTEDFDLNTFSCLEMSYIMFRHLSHWYKNIAIMYGARTDSEFGEIAHAWIELDDYAIECTRKTIVNRLWTQARYEYIAEFYSIEDYECFLTRQRIMPEHEDYLQYRRLLCNTR